MITKTHMRNLFIQTHLHNETSTPFRVYAPADRISKMQYAMDFGKATLNYYEEIFALPFPLPKSGKWSAIFLFTVEYT